MPTPGQLLLAKNRAAQRRRRRRTPTTSASPHPPTHRQATKRQCPEPPAPAPVPEADLTLLVDRLTAALQEARPAHVKEELHHVFEELISMLAAARGTSVKNLSDQAVNAVWGYLADDRRERSIDNKFKKN